MYVVRTYVYIYVCMYVRTYVYICMYVGASDVYLIVVTFH